MISWVMLQIASFLLNAGLLVAVIATAKQKKAIETALADAEKELIIVFRELGKTSGLAEEANKVATEAGARASVHERRATEFFNIIEGIEKERDTWQKLYYESSRQSGVAQAWLSRDLDAAVRRANILATELRKLGKNVKDIAVNPALQEVLADFGLHPDNKGQAVAGAPGLEKAQTVNSEILADLPKS
jgi:hypothetical protein